MAYPNITRQSDSLQTRLHNLLIIKKNFKQLATKEVTSLADLRHKATNYDSIRKEDVLTKYVDDLADYSYSLEYLQTYVKDMVNTTIANKLLALNSERSAQYQALVSEKSSECETLRTEMKHLDLLIKSLKKEREADQLKLQQHENRIEELEAKNTQLEAKNVQLESNIDTLNLNVKELVVALKTEVNQRVEDIQRVTAEARIEREEALTKLNNEWRVTLKETLEENNRQWEIKFEENNRQWQAKYDAQRAYFEAEIAEVRGRLDNLEAQMKALQADTDAFKVKVNELTLPISNETKQEVTRDLANLVALSYSTVANLQLVDPQYEQRRTWFALLKEVFKLTKQLTSKFGFNLKQHLNFMTLMFKTNPC